MIVLKVNENYSSQIPSCWSTEHDIDHHPPLPNAIPPVNQRLQAVNGLNAVRRCPHCDWIWNRDVNGATNIYRIAKNAINGTERPKYLCREKKEDNVKVEKPKKEKVKKIVQKKVNKSVKVDALTKS